MGRPDDAVSTARFLNRTCALAGVAHRLDDVDVNEGNAAELERTFGPSLVQLARRTYPEPFFDNATTVAALDYRPISLDDGLSRTIDWFATSGGSEARRMPNACTPAATMDGARTSTTALARGETRRAPRRSLWMGALYAARTTATTSGAVTSTALPVT